MGGSYSTHRRNQKCVQYPTERDNLEDLGVDVTIILKCVLEK